MQEAIPVMVVGTRTTRRRLLKTSTRLVKLTKDEFLNLDGMRVKRNNVVHHDAKAMHPDAESFLATAEGLTRTKLGILKPLF